MIFSKEEGEDEADWTTEYLEQLGQRSLKMRDGMGDRHMSKFPNAWSPYYKFLAQLMMYREPEAGLECGVYGGEAVAHMAHGGQVAKSIVIGVDLNTHPDFEKNVSPWKDRVVFVQGNTTIGGTVDRVRDALGGKKIGVFHIDSSHDFGTPKREFQLYSEFFDSPCIVACDDIGGGGLQAQKMEKFWGWLPGDKVRLNYLHPYPGGDLPDPGYGATIIR